MVPALVQRVEPHAVGVEVQPLAAVQHDVVIDRENDRPAAGQVQFPGVPDGLDLTLHGGRVDLVRGVAQEPEDDRADTAMAMPGRPERAEQLNPQPGDVGRGPGVDQLRHEHSGGFHWPDGVRAGRPDPDLEKVENADGHSDAAS